MTVICPACGELVAVEANPGVPEGSPLAGKVRSVRKKLVQFIIVRFVHKSEGSAELFLEALRELEEIQQLLGERGLEGQGGPPGQGGA